MIAPMTLVPVLGHPLEATALAQPPTLHPDMLTTVPTVIARRPHIIGTRCWHCYDARRWRGDLDIHDGCIAGCHRTCK